MPPVVAAIASFAAASAINAFIVQIGISLALSFVARTLFAPKMPRPAELIRELAIPKSRPPYRFVYGRYRTYGTPAPWRVKGNTLYGAIILNSRPSAGGTLNLYIDKRTPTSVTGDPYNFAGDGLRFQLPSPAAAFDSSNRPRVWLSLGDKTSPPSRFLTGAPEYFQNTDGWQGRTVLWIELQAGGTEERGDRWPRVPPEIEVELDWSKVWDPRDPAQDPDDESTWTFSKNQALILLDALRQNPIRKFGASNLIIDQFIEAADVADEAVALKAGGTEPRYQANGVIIWDGREIEAQVQPIVDSGAGTVVRAGGRLGYLAGEYRAPDFTIDDLLEDGGIEFQRLLPGRDVPNGVMVSYINPDRDWKEADLPVYQVPGAPPVISNDGATNISLPFCTSPTQAMRIQKIAALKLGKQKRLSCTLPPKAFDLIAGSTVTVNIPAFPQINGTWDVDTINAGISISEPEGGVALRVPVQLSETAADVYAWDPATDEIDLATESFVPTRPAVSPPANLVAVSGPDQVVSGQPRIRFSFDPSPSDAVTDYEWQWREVGGIYEQGGLIDSDVRDANGDVFGHLAQVESGSYYDIRVRAITINRASVWIEVTNIQASGTFANASGGTVTEPIIGGVRYRVHTFTSSGTFSVLAPGIMDYVIVGGGGSGGTGGGGGGAGGVVQGSQTFAAGNLSVVVGAGGPAQPGYDATGYEGDPSSFNGATAIGGGAGGGWGKNGTNGGSGGGGGGRGGNVGGDGTSGQGNDGGNAVNEPSYGGRGASGGGGGASQVGGNGTATPATDTWIAGDGGDGVDLSNLFGTGVGDSGWFAGGGGGSKGYGNGNAGAGGAGGGGAGGENVNNGGSALPNTGGGGGGGGWAGSGSSGAGGSGVVVIRYPIA